MYLRRTILASVLFLSLFAAAQEAKKTLQPDDYKQWESLQAAAISNDGRWLTYVSAKVGGDNTLVVKNNDTPATWSTRGGSGAAFSDDSKWAAYIVTPQAPGAGGGPRPGGGGPRPGGGRRPGGPGGPTPAPTPGAPAPTAPTPPPTKLGLRNLSSGDEQVFEGVQRYQFLKGSKFLLAQSVRPATRTDGGTDLLVLNLETGDSLNLGNVVDAMPNNDGSLVALTIKSDSGLQAVQILNPATQSLKSLTGSKDDIYSVSWARKADVLVYMRGKSDEKKEGDLNSIVVVNGIAAGKPKATTLETVAREDFPVGTRAVEFSGARLNEDGTRVAFGSQTWADKKAPSAVERVPVEVWNSKDIQVMPRQKLTAAGDRRRTNLWVWDLATDHLNQVTKDPEESAQLIGNFDRALILDQKPYETAATDGFNYQDVYLADVARGSRTVLLKKTHNFPVISRKANYLAYFERKNWWLYDLRNDKKTNLTGSVKTSFENTEDDHTVPEKPAAGFPIWLADDAGLLVSDHYDVWLARTGTLGLTQLTNGAKDHQIHRFTDIEGDENGHNLNHPFYFRVLDERAKATGYFTCDATGKGAMLAMDNMAFNGLTKAKDADRVFFQMGSFEKSPNLFLTNIKFSAIKPETSTNPQQKDFLWGHTDLVPFKSRWGKELNGILIYPADYDPKKTYPMVTYIYERLSDGLHNYVNPVDWSAYNPQVLSQNGYFVFEPDIAYKGRMPGENAVDCLEPAVAAVLAMKVGVDPQRIGLMGHSWGAYQTAFVTSVSKIFKVGVAGAPLTELTSMYNTFYWNSGTSNQELLETGQGRLEVPFWDDPKTYMDNSPVWRSKTRIAPILITCGDKDGAVDYHQGMALYQTLRRMGKDCVLLIYADENHNFTKRPDQLDYAHRVRHYLDVYLKGAKPEPWVSDGVSYLKQSE